MKITDISILIEPTADENVEATTLRRMPNKGWRAETSSGVRDCLFPGEMEIILKIQEIIQIYNGKLKK